MATVIPIREDVEPAECLEMSAALLQLIFTAATLEDRLVARFGRRKLGRRVLSDLDDLRTVSEEACHVHRLQVEAFNRQVDQFDARGDRIEGKIAELQRRLGISDRPELELVKGGDDA